MEPQNLSERIVASQEELATLKDDLVESTKLLEVSPEEESLLIQVEELAAKVDKHTNTLEALQKAESALAARAQRNVEAPAVIPSMKKEAKGDGSLFFKHATAKVIAHAEKKAPEQVIAERYGDDMRVKESFDFLTKTAVNPAMTSTTGWAAELVQSDTRGFIDTLKDVSVAAALAGRSTMLDFGGFNRVTIPRRNPLAATLTEPSWVAEGSALPVTSFNFGSATINRYKLGAITTMSKEIADRSTPAIEGLLQDALREAYAEVLDSALLSNAALVANVRPAGLLNGVTLATGTAGGGEAAVRADVLTMLTSLTTAKLGKRPVLLVNNLDQLAVSMMTSAMSEYLFRDELSTGRLLGIEVIASANVPVHTAILVDAAYLATAFDAPTFDVSDVATVTEANADAAAPTQAIDAAGAIATAGQVGAGGIPVAGGTGAGTAGYTARSLWQTMSLGIRMVAPTSWATLQPGAVAATATSTWS